MPCFVLRSEKIIEEISGLAIIGEAADGLELLDLLKTMTPDMIILDISMPHIRGLEATVEIKTVHPQIKIVVLTMHRESLHQGISAGADGYLLKDDTDTELISCDRQDPPRKNLSIPLRSEYAMVSYLGASSGVSSRIPLPTGRYQS